MTKFDFSLTKVVRVREKVDVQIRAETFNAFNNSQFWMPNTAFVSFDFGKITASQQILLPL